MIYEPNFERFRMTLLGEQADRVPNAEVLVAQDVKEVMLGKPISSMKEEVEFWESFGYDYVPIVAGLLGPGKITDASKIFQVVRRSLFNTQEVEEKEEWAVEGKGIIQTMEDFDKFDWADSTSLDLSKFEEVQSYIPDQMKIVIVGGKIFTIVWMLMGFECMCLNSVRNPALVSKLFEKIGSLQLEALQKAIDVGKAGALWLVDDIAYNTGLMISPKHLRQFLFPWYQEMVNLCSKHDIPVIYHSDGNIWEVLPDIIAIGAKALHPLEPKAMDIKEVKDKVKGKLALIGNIDVDSLARKTPEEITEEVTERLRYIAPGGGYCLGSSNSIPNWAKLDNYRAMLKANYDFGKYPITL